MKKPKIFIVSQAWYLTPFEDLFEVTSSLKEADVCLFTGGEDVSPELYSEPRGSNTYINRRRDLYEKNIISVCNSFGIKKLGICRGAQFLTVMSGGKLVQDVSNHTRSHNVFTRDGRLLSMSSTHHQMMNPFELPMDMYNLKAWAAPRLSSYYLNGNGEKVPGFAERCIEPEIVWYPTTKSLAIQPHPEIMDKNSPGVVFCRELVKDYLC